MEVLKSYFNFKPKSEADILKDIMFFKKKRLYKVALKISATYYFPSDKIYFWYLFFLLKLGRRREFFRNFTAKPIGRAIPLFTKIYLNRRLKVQKIFLIRKLYVRSPDSQVFAYIYANFLFQRGYINRSKYVLMNFLNNKRILMTDIYCSYLMNLLAIKIEKTLNGESANDFTLSYNENIEAYHEKRK